MTLIALMGANALWFLYLWLFSCIVAGYFSERKGYGEKAGLATGLCLSAVAIIVWLVVAGQARLQVEGARTVRPRQGRGPQARLTPFCVPGPLAQRAACGAGWRSMQASLNVKRCPRG